MTPLPRAATSADFANLLGAVALLPDAGKSPNRRNDVPDGLSCSHPGARAKTPLGKRFSSIGTRHSLRGKGCAGTVGSGGDLEVVITQTLQRKSAPVTNRNARIEA